MKNNFLPVYTQIESIGCELSLIMGILDRGSRDREMKMALEKFNRGPIIRGLGGVDSFKIGDNVIIRKSGKTACISKITQHGFFILEGYKNLLFTKELLRSAEPP